MKDYIVYIGRFQPFHCGHLKTLKSALEKANEVIICLGSAFKSRTIKNPFTVFEREMMIRSCLSPQEESRIHFKYIKDRLYQESRWIRDVQHTVASVTGSSVNPSIGIVGMEKGESSYYINCFKDQWEVILMPMEEGKSTDQHLNATDIREVLFSGKSLMYLLGTLPESVLSYISSEFMQMSEFMQLKEEYNLEVNYQNQYVNFPYAVNFLTSDAVVIQSGHILMIQRKKSPGKNLWALPGGHVNSNESVKDAMIRELLEETQIDLPKRALVGSIKDSYLFDHPDRSIRCRVDSKKGRTVSVAFYVHLDDSQKLPKIKASDDAVDAKWVPLGDLSRMGSYIFEDHLDIIELFLGK